MIDKSPLVSVILPTYNRGEVISRAIDSVLRQTISDFEVIIVDDFSEDNTEQIVKAYSNGRIKYVKHNRNKGGSAARNTGIRNAKGEYIAFLDSDDEFSSTKLERQLECLNKLPNRYVGCYCGSNTRLSQKTGWFKKQIEETFPNERTTPEGQQEVIKDIFLTKIEIGGCSTLFIKKNIIDKMNGFDEKYPRHQDYEFLIRALEYGPIGYLAEDLVTKHETGNPDPLHVEYSKSLLLDYFSEEIDEDTNLIRQRQYFSLGCKYLRESQYLNAIRCLYSGRPKTIRDMLELLNHIIASLS